MLTHIVCWKYKAETTPEMRADHRAKLMALPEIIRNSVSFNVGEDILHLERSFDTGLVAVFTDRAALDFYSDHPEHQKVAALGRGISEKVVSVDFLSEFSKHLSTQHRRRVDVDGFWLVKEYFLSCPSKLWSDQQFVATPFPALLVPHIYALT